MALLRCWGEGLAPRDLKAADTLRSWQGHQREQGRPATAAWCKSGQRRAPAEVRAAGDGAGCSWKRSESTGVARPGLGHSEGEAVPSVPEAQNCPGIATSKALAAVPAAP